MSVGQIKPKMTDIAIKKLEEVFAIDGTIEEAAFYADITPQTYHNWVKEFPELKERFDKLRNNPVLKARRAVVKGLDNYQNSMDYLKRKRKLEFGDNMDVTSGNKPLPLMDLSKKNEDKRANS